MHDDLSIGTDVGLSHARATATVGTLILQGTGSGGAGDQVVVVGAGPHALAAGLSLLKGSTPVRLVWLGNQIPEEIDVWPRGEVALPDRSALKFEITSTNIRGGLEQADSVLISCADIRYSDIAAGIAGTVIDRQVVFLLDAPLGAALQFKKLLEHGGRQTFPAIVEMSCLFDRVRIDSSTLLAYNPRPRVSICGLSRNDTRRGLELADRWWRGLVPASNILERGLADIECFIRPVLRLFYLAAGAVSRYSDLINDQLVAIISALCLEVNTVARSYALPVHNPGKFLRDYCGATGHTFKELLNCLEEGLKEDLHHQPEAIEHCNRALIREIGNTFVLLSELALLSSKPVPLTDSIIRLGSALAGQDVRRLGRSLDHLGLVGLGRSEVIEIVNR